MGGTIKPCYIDIFAGCGGLSLGLYKSGWQGIFAIEKNKMAFETLKYNLIDKTNHYNWPSWLPVSNHDINEIILNYENELNKLNGKIDLVAGGPPCQGFSFAGKRKEDDERNELVGSYIKFISLVKPKILFFENVKGFTVRFNNNKTRGETYSDYVRSELELLGYKVSSKVVDFSDYGLPQRRKRFILVGVIDNDPEVFFENIVKRKKIFLKNKGINENITLEEAISDLEQINGEVTYKDDNRFKCGKYGIPKSNYQMLLRKDSKNDLPDSHRFANHNEQTVEKFRYILDNCPRDVNISKNIKEKYNIKKHSIITLSKNSQCPTLTTLPDDYIHYSEPRILTVREYARIQSFDDWFEFKSKYTSGGCLRKFETPRYTQVGNAIPPLFMELSGKVLKDLV